MYEPKYFVIEIHEYKTTIIFLLLITPTILSFVLQMKVLILFSLYFYSSVNFSSCKVTDTMLMLT
jgi:hypothetical protein